MCPVLKKLRHWWRQDRLKRWLKVRRARKQIKELERHLRNEYDDLSGRGFYAIEMFYESLVGSSEDMPIVIASDTSDKKLYYTVVNLLDWHRLNWDICPHCGAIGSEWRKRGWFPCPELKVYKGDYSDYDNVERLIDYVSGRMRSEHARII